MASDKGFEPGQGMSTGLPIENNSKGKPAGSVLLGQSSEATEIYDDGTYTYICKAPYGSALTSAVWGVTRVDNSTGSSRSSAAGQLATSVTVVAALTYNNGV